MRGALLAALLPALAVVSTGCLEPTAVVIEPLRVIHWSPSTGSRCVHTGASVFSVFSHDVDDASLTAETYYLVDEDSNPVASEIIYDPTSFTSWLTPQSDLAYDAVYTSIATVGVSSPDTGNLSVELSSSFKTWPRQGCTPGVECQLPSDCDGNDICLNGECQPECLVDKDCHGETCVDGGCTR